MEEALAFSAQLIDSQSWLAVLVNLSLKGALVLLVALAGCRAAARSSASLRHWIGAAAVGALLALPLLSALLPSWQVPLLPGPPLTIAESSAPQAVSLSMLPHDGTAFFGLGPLFSHWPFLLVTVWLVGLVFLLSRLIFAMTCVYLLLRRSTPAGDSFLQKLADRTAHELEIGRRVRLHFSDRLEVALSIGLWRPVVLMPSAARHWETDRLRSILLHEMAHVKRWDNAVNLLCQIACAVYWFNPLVWWTSRRLTLERERASDDAVLNSGTKASEYATHLLEVSRAVVPSSRILWKPLEVSQSSALHGRLKAILDSSMDRSPLGRRALFGTLVCVAFLAPVAAFQPWVDMLERWSEDRPQIALEKKRGLSQHSLLRGEQDLAALDPGQRMLDLGQGFVAGWSSDEAGSGRSRAAEQEGRSGEAAGQENEFAREARDLIRKMGEFEGQAAPSGLPLAGPGIGLDRQQLAQEFFDVPPGRSGGGDDTSQEPIDPLPPLPGQGDGNPPNPKDPDPPKPPDFRMAPTVIDDLGGGFSQALVVSNSGQAAGCALTSDGAVTPYFWDEDKGITSLDPPLGFKGGELTLSGMCGRKAARVTAINEQGQIAGVVFSPFGETTAFHWSASRGMTLLGALGGGFSHPHAINADGIVVGAAQNEAGLKRAFLWDPRQGTMQDLGGPKNVESHAFDINSRGHVVGEIGGRAFLYLPDKGIFRIGPEDLFCRARNISDSGVIAGEAAFEPGTLTPFRWTESQGIQDLGPINDRYVIHLVSGLSELGDIVGVASTGPLDPLVETTSFSSSKKGLALLDRYGIIGLDVDSVSLRINGLRRLASRVTDSFGLERAFVSDPGADRVDLQGADSSDRRWPNDINDGGEVAGALQAIGQEGIKSVIWRPVPLGDDDDSPSGGQSETSDTESSDTEIDGPLDFIPVLGGLGRSAGSSPKLADSLRIRLSNAERMLRKGRLQAAKVELFRYSALILDSAQSGEIDSDSAQWLVKVARLISARIDAASPSK